MPFSNPSAEFEDNIDRNYALEASSLILTDGGVDCCLRRIKGATVFSASYMSTSISNFVTFPDVCPD